jgi:hypothetical protein
MDDFYRRGGSSVNTKIKHGLYQLAIALDQLLNVALNPLSLESWADETMSSRCWRQRHRYPYKAYRVVIDAMFWAFQGADHCENAFRKEREGRHLPPELRA